MSGFNPNQFSQSGNNYFQQSSKVAKSLQGVDLSNEAIEQYRKDRDDPTLQRKRLREKVIQQRTDLQERWAESKRIYEELNGPIEAGFGGPSDKGGGDSELGLDYLA